MKKLTSPPYLLIVGGFQLISIFFSTLIAIAFSKEARGLWPFVVLVESVLAAFFVAGVCGITRKTHLSSLYTYGFNLLAIAAHIGLVTFFYLHRIDWLAINNGLKKLNWVEQLLTNPLSGPATYALFLIMHLIVVVYRKKSANSNN